MICSKHSVFLIVFAHLNVISEPCSHCYPTSSAKFCSRSGDFLNNSEEYCLDERDGFCSTTPGKTILDDYVVCKPKGTLPFNTMFKS